MITVIATVLNEADNIELLLKSLLRQSRSADAIVIVDGGSRDATLEILQHYSSQLPLKVLSFPNCNISEGRNRAIEAAQGDLIAVTDAGLFLSDTWLEALEKPLLDDETLQIVGGLPTADGQSLFELALGAIVAKSKEEIQPSRFLPGSNCIAFRKTLWERLGGYPEWLDFGEDMVFVRKARMLAKHVAFAPQAQVFFRPRPSVRAFFKQYYHYSRGDGKADLWPLRHAVRYTTYCLAFPALIILSLIHSPLWWIVLLLAAALYLHKPYQRLMTAKPANPLDMLILCFWLPLLRLVGDLAKMLGYPAGCLWRIKHSPPDWRTI